MKPRHDDGPTASVAGTLLFLIFGFVLWFAQFSIAYGATTLACAIWTSDAVADLAIGATTLAALALAGVYLVRGPWLASRFGLPSEPELRHQLVTAGRIAVAIAVVAILWTATTIAFLEACIPDR